MILRAVTARWFEALVPRTRLIGAVEALATTRSVELDATIGQAAPLDLSRLRQGIQEYSGLAQRYAAWWPPAAAGEPGDDTHLEELLREALERIERWRVDADPVIHRVERLHGERHEIELVRAFIDAARAADGRPLAPGRVAGVEPPLGSALFVLAPDAPIPPIPAPTIHRVLRTDRHAFLLTLGPAETIRAITADMAARKARAVQVPATLADDLEAARRQCERRDAELEQSVDSELETMRRLAGDHDLARALGHLQRTAWMLDHVSGLPVSDDLAWVTGWTIDTSGEQCRAVLERAGIPAVLHFPPPPEGKTPPTFARNPRWARPFELFAGLLGTPGRDEADPSPLVAGIAPLMFGYMFGDVGQGAVLIAAGLVLRRRMPTLALLIPGGAMAMVFGVLFGSVFAMENVIPALWLHPIAQPVPVLAVPLVAGGAVIVLGLALAGVSAAWHRRGARWLATEGGLVAAYCSMLLGLVHAAAFAGAVLGALWFVAGHAWVRWPRPLAGAAGGVGELLERAMQLAVNTLSFVRIGAFALAHAGLSLAVVGLAQASDALAVQIIVLVLGNAVIIALEGLVVSVQTTRLILFEFFTRFLQGEGRPFRPLPVPTHLH